MSMLAGVFVRSGRKVLHENGPVPSVMPDENILAMKLGMAAFMRGLPPDTYYFYVHDSPAGVQEHKELIGQGKYAFFKMQTYGARYSAIDEVFKRLPTHGIAVYEVVVSDDEGWADIIYVNMMTVRPGWKRNGLNMAMMRKLIEEYPGRKLAFSAPTPNGRAYIEAAVAAGLPVELPKSMK